MQSSSSRVNSSITLCEDDIPGAALPEPLESHNVAALKWWLLCRGIKVKSCCRKKDIIERIREAITSGAQVIDVDGSYLARKQQQLHLESSGECTDSSIDIRLPVSGWEVISTENYQTFSNKMPTVTLGNNMNVHAWIVNNCFFSVMIRNSV